MRREPIDLPLAQECPRSMFHNQEFNNHILDFLISVIEDMYSNKLVLHRLPIPQHAPVKRIDVWVKSTKSDCHLPSLSHCRLLPLMLLDHAALLGIPEGNCQSEPSDSVAYPVLVRHRARKF